MTVPAKGRMKCCESAETDHTMTDTPAHELPTSADEEELLKELSELIKEKGLHYDGNAQSGDQAARQDSICTNCILCTYAW